MISMRLILVVVGAVVLHLTFALGFMACRHSADQEVEAEIKALQSRWSSEVEQMEAKMAALETDYGASRLDRIAVDPRMNIQTVITKLFEAVLPETCELEVSVDRFTEFSVRIKAYSMPEKKELAGFLQQVFSRLEPGLVYQVIFYVEDQYIVVDGEQLKSIRNWAAASTDEIIAKCL